MQINIIPEVKDVKTDTATVKTTKPKTKDFDNTLKDCEDENKSAKDESTDKEDNNTAGILGALAVQVPVNLQNITVVKPESVMPSVEATEKVGSVTDEGSSSAENAQTAFEGPIDAGYTKLIVSNPLLKTDNTAKISTAEGTNVENTFSNTLENAGFYSSENVVPKADFNVITVAQTNSEEIQTSVETNAEAATFESPINTANTENSESTDNTLSAKLQNNTPDDVTFTVNTGSVKPQQQMGKAATETQTADAADTADIAVDTQYQATKADDGQKQNTESDKKDDSSFVNNLAAANTESTSKVQNGDKFPQQLKVNTANQVADAVKDAVQSGRTEVRIHLNPEDLGPISVRIISQNGALSLQISAENEKTGQLIATSMHELSQSMQDKGITMEKAEVTYADSSNLDTATFQQGQQFSQNEQYRQNDQNGDYSLPKWTVAMETGGKTAKDIAAPEPVEAPIKNDDSSYSILV